MNQSQIKDKLKEQFNELKFEEIKHEYAVGDQKLTSVSKFISRYTPEFDAERIAGFVAKARNITVEEVLQEWEDAKNFACELGNRSHYFGENFKKRGLIPENGYEEAILKFWAELPDHYEVLSFELQMYCKKKGIAGTADIVLLNTLTGKLVIVDYKTNKDLYKNYKKQTLLAPFDRFLNMPISKYTIQLSFYQILISQIGLEVEERWIIWVKPTGIYELLKTEDLTEEIENLFNF